MKRGKEVTHDIGKFDKPIGTDIKTLLLSAVAENVRQCLAVSHIRVFGWAEHVWVK